MEEREKLILDNEKIVYKVLQDLKLYDKLEDYYDLGIIGLIKAVDTYDKKKGYTFSTYAYKCISNEINMELRKQNRNKYKANYNTVSLEEVICSNDSKTEIKLGEVIPDKTDIEEEAVMSDDIKLLYKAIDKLDPEEQMIINRCFGLNGYEESNQCVIADYLGISQTRISKRKDKIVNKLRRIMEEL